VIPADTPDLELKEAQKAIFGLLNLKKGGSGDKSKQMLALQNSLANLIKGNQNQPTENQNQYADIETGRSKGNQNQNIGSDTGRSMISKESPRTQSPT
jgi:hypothetical protein